MSRQAIVIPLVKKLTNIDGWMNLLTGLGIRGKDKQQSTFVTWEPMPEQTAADLYSADPISAKIINLLPEEAFKKGYEIKGLSDKETTALKERIKQVFLNEKALEVCKWSRLYGTAALYAVAKDTKSVDAPFVPNSEVTGFRVFTKWEMSPITNSQASELDDPDFGKYMMFQVNPRNLTNTYNIVVHRSRMCFMHGSKLPQINAARLNGFSDSILTALLPALRGYATAHDAAANVLNDFRISLFKIKGLAEALASDNDGAVMKRLEMLNLGRSVAKTVMLDSEGEDFEYRESNIAGVAPLIEKVEDRLVTESEYPHTVLLGQSPEGSNATGNSTQTQWYDYVAQYQETEILPMILPMIRRLAAGMGMKNADKIEVEFLPLMVMDEKADADIRKTQAEIDQIYITEGVVDPIEIAKSRFGGEEYSKDTQIDLSLRDRPKPTEEDIEATKVPKEKPTTEDA